VGTDAFVVAGVLPAIAKETGVTVGLAGQLVTLFSIAYGVSAPLLMALTGRLAPTRVLLMALSAFCLANVASALAPTFPLLLLTRILAGCLVAAYAPLAFAVAVQLAPRERRGQALGLVAGGYTLATVLGSPLGTWVGEHLSWRMSFGLVAVLAGGALFSLPDTFLRKRMMEEKRTDLGQGDEEEHMRSSQQAEHELFGGRPQWMHVVYSGRTGRSN
jgi:MFS transporter, DHA1 family, inner membrane transport protein